MGNSNKLPVSYQPIATDTMDIELEDDKIKITEQKDAANIETQDPRT